MLRRVAESGDRQATCVGWQTGPRGSGSGGRGVLTPRDPRGSAPSSSELQPRAEGAAGRGCSELRSLGTVAAGFLFRNLGLGLGTRASRISRDAAKVPGGGAGEAGASIGETSQRSRQTPSDDVRKDWGSLLLCSPFYRSGKQARDLRQKKVIASTVESPKRSKMTII